MTSTEPHLRIGELSRRTGVSPSVLRAWERRYSLLRPERSSGGLRLFSAADQERIGVMQAHMRSGLSAAEAARATLGGTPTPTVPAADGPAEATGNAPGAADAMRGAAGRAAEVSAPELAVAFEALTNALARLDADGAQRAIDRLLAAASFEAIAAEVLLPYLNDLGVRWSAGEASVAEEHFATHLLRGRMLGLANGPRPGDGPRAVLAAPPGERHDIALLILAVALERRGWNVALLGADTPIESVREAAQRLEADYVVLAATKRERLTGVVPELQALAQETKLLLAGAGASTQIGRRVGAGVLRGDPIAAAAELDGEARSAG